MKEKIEAIQFEWVEKTSALLKSMAERIVTLENRMSTLEKDKTQRNEIWEQTG